LVVIATTDGSTAVITDTKSGKAELVAVEGAIDIGSTEGFVEVLGVDWAVGDDEDGGILLEAGETISKLQLATASINMSIVIIRKTELVFNFIAIILSFCFHYWGFLEFATYFENSRTKLSFIKAWVPCLYFNISYITNVNYLLRVKGL
jgi:amino acid permease